MNMRERELVKVVHTFSVDNGFVADKYAIQTAYRKHPIESTLCRTAYAVSVMSLMK